MLEPIINAAAARSLHFLAVMAYLQWSKYHGAKDPVEVAKELKDDVDSCLAAADDDAIPSAKEFAALLEVLEEKQAVAFADVRQQLATLADLVRSYLTSTGSGNPFPPAMEAPPAQLTPG